MPYVVRDGDGNVRAVFDTPVEGAEEVAPDDPGLGAFINQNAQTGMVLDEWVESDLALVRVVEDLVEVLIDKGVFMFNELPSGAQKKLNTRRGRRKEMDLMESLFGEMALPEGEDPSNGNTGGGSGGGSISLIRPLIRGRRFGD